VVTATGSLSDRAILRTARDLRACAWALEAGLYLLPAGLTLAIGGVHVWAYVPAFWLTAVLLTLLACRAVLVTSLRRRIGARRFCFHPSGLWLVLDEESAYGLKTWSFDLSRPLLPFTWALVPWALFLTWTCAQLLLLPPGLVAFLAPGRDAGAAGAWLPLTTAVAETRRAAAFVAWALGLHLVALTVLDASAARRRFRRAASGFGLLLALFALGQMASGTGRIYGLFLPQDWQGTRTLFGPFVNRNHFAACANLLLPLALGLAWRALSRLARRVGPRANLRRRVVALQSPEGIAAIYALVTALALVAALVASGSRGGLVACVGGLLAAAVVGRRRRAAVLVPLALGALIVTWYGSERGLGRFRLAASDAPGRTLVWRDALQQVPGTWLTGSGLNTFAATGSRATVFRLPRGATPWREPYETSVVQAPRQGFRAILGTPLLTWNAAVHNDYLQLLVESGVPGLLLALATLVLLTSRARGDLWVLAGLVAVAVHSAVDFPLQIPAVAALFVTVAALPRLTAPAASAPREAVD
jgi:O-antigen ligase